MCERADFVSFYIGHSAGDPPPMIPRYEFLASLRQYESSGEPGSSLAAQQVGQTVQRIVNALGAVGVTPDRDHNFLTNKMLVKIVPSPIYRAHEFAKSLGRKLDTFLEIFKSFRMMVKSRPAMKRWYILRI